MLVMPMSGCLDERHRAQRRVIRPPAVDLALAGVLAPAIRSRPWLTCRP